MKKKNITKIVINGLEENKVKINLEDLRQKLIKYLYNLEQFNSSDVEIIKILFKKRLDIASI